MGTKHYEPLTKRQSSV